MHCCRSRPPHSALAPNANPDRDPYRNTSFTASVVQRLSAAHELSASLYRQQGRAAYDNAFGAPTDTHQIDSRSTNLALGWKASLGPNWQSRVTLGANIDESDSRTNSDAPERVHTHSRQLDWRNDVALGAGQTASVGLGTAQQRVASDTAYDRSSRRTDSLTLGYNADVSATQVQANLRHDRHSDVGAATTGLLGAGWRMTEAWKLLATVSTAFNAPTFNLLYFPGFGNPNLKPERARSAELGAQYASGTTLARVAWFDTRYRDLIDFPPPNFVPTNIATARVKGLEISASGEWAGWRVRGSATLQDPKDAAGDTLRRRARHFGSVDAARDFGAWRVQAGVATSGARHDTDLNFDRVELEPYTLLSLSGGYKLASELWLTARVTNATATNYSTVYAYPAPARELHVGIAWRH